MVECKYKWKEELKSELIKKLVLEKKNESLIDEAILLGQKLDLSDKKIKITKDIYFNTQ